MTLDPPLPNHFDGPVAAAYDEGSAAMFAPEVLDPAVDLLAALAGPGGSALELAVGTGRVALPLAARGIRVHGIDLSEAMLDRLRAKDPDGTVSVTAGDMATTSVPGTFDVAYLVFNTIGNLTTQDQQVAAFANAARHLVPGGRFVVEVGVPQLQKVPVGERFHVFAHTPERSGVDEYDVLTQAMWSHHTWVADDGTVGRASVPFRYVWPAELDLMARLAGMTLEDRWASFSRDELTATSPSHVSVWRRTDG